MHYQSHSQIRGDNTVEQNEFQCWSEIVKNKPKHEKNIKGNDLKLDDAGWVSVSYKNKKTIDKSSKLQNNGSHIGLPQNFRQNNNKPIQRERKNQEELRKNRTKNDIPVHRTDKTTVPVDNEEIHQTNKTTVDRPTRNKVLDITAGGPEDLNIFCNSSKSKAMGFKEKVENINVETEEQLLKKVKKQINNQENKLKREKKLRNLKEENLRKGAKVQCISQEIMTTFSSATGSSLSNNALENQKHVYSLFEYPSLTNSFRRARNTKENSPRLSFPSTSNEENIEATNSGEVGRNVSNSKNKNSISRKTKSRYHVQTKNTVQTSKHSLCETESSHNAQTKDSAKISYSPPRLSESTEEILSEKSPVKKAVKSTDPVTFDIFDFIQVKKKKDKLKQVKSKIQAVSVPVKVEKKGKITEGKKKKISTLKKNMRRHEKSQIEVFHSTLTNFNTLKNETETTEASDSNLGNETPTDVSEDKENIKEAAIAEAIELDNMSGKTLESAVVLKEANYSEKPSGEAWRRVGHEPVRPSKISPAVIRQEFVAEIKLLQNPIHSKKFREYCDHVITPEINEALEEFLDPLVMFQSRTFKQDPIKAKMKRRYYCGLKEALKHMKRITCIIMAPNLKHSPGPGCVDELVNKVLSAASTAGIPVIFGLAHYKLGRICHKKVSVSCISILINGTQGIQDKFSKVMDLIPSAKKQYEILLATVGLRSSESVIEAVEDSAGVCHEGKKDSHITNSLLEALKT